MSISTVQNLFPNPRSASAQLSQPLRVFVVSNMGLLRDGIVHALSQMSSFQMIGASDLSAMPRSIAALAPDVLLLDFTFAGGLEASKALHGCMPAVKIVALGVSEAEGAVLACAGAGVSAFVAPECSAADVAAAVHSAVRGELVCSPRTAGALLSQLSAMSVRPAADVDGDLLTAREREIIELISEGFSNKEIARAAGIQHATVKNHVHSILSKLRLRRRGEVTALLRRSAGSVSGSIAMPPPAQPAAAGQNGNGSDMGHLI